MSCDTGYDTSKSVLRPNSWNDTPSHRSKSGNDTPVHRTIFGNDTLIYRWKPRLQSRTSLRTWYRTGTHFFYQLYEQKQPTDWQKFHTSLYGHTRHRFIELTLACFKSIVINKQDKSPINFCQNPAINGQFSFVNIVTMGSRRAFKIARMVLTLFLSRIIVLINRLRYVLKGKADYCRNEVRD